MNCPCCKLPGLLLSDDRKRVVGKACHCHTSDILEYLSGAPVPVPAPEKPEPPPMPSVDAAEPEPTEEAKQNSGTTSAKLIRIGTEATLFKLELDGDAYARFVVAGHAEIHRVRSRAFRDLLYHRFYTEEGKPPNAQAVDDALHVLEARARFNGETHELHIRSARHDGALWIDLTNEQWQAIRLTPEGWQVIDNPPILFQRYSVSAPQILPRPGGCLELLRNFLNVRDEAAWVQVVVWLVAAYLPEIAHPILIVHGEQGSAKSTMLRLLSSLVDPSRIPLRSAPRDATEWVQQASHAWAVMLDNVSDLPQWFSDALCRAVTGEGFSKRVLYSDDDDAIYSFRRVLAFDGIEAATQRPDVLDRAILLPLEPISPSRRRSETEVLSDFERIRPLVFGALLDTLCAVLRILPTVRLQELPRMADFARVGVAVEQVLEWEPGTFLSAYRANVASQHDEAIGASIVGEALRAFCQSESDGWTGTAQALLDRLAVYGPNTKQRDWPKTGRGLSGQLKRLAPNLRGIGIYLHYSREAGTGNRLITLSREEGQTTVTTVTTVTSTSNPVTVGSESVTIERSSPLQSSHPFPSHGDDCDDCDDRIPNFSGSNLSAFTH